MSDSIEITVEDTKQLGRWVTWSVAAVVVISVAVWWIRRDRLPARIRIASGVPSGVYHEIGDALRLSLDRRLGYASELLDTAGSVENFSLLMKGEAELAIVQGGAAPLEKAAVVTPLHPEWLIILGRRERNIEDVSDLVGKRVAIGKEGSGMRASALNLLEHMNIRDEEYDGVNEYFRHVLEDDTIDAAIVTTGVRNHDLREILLTGDFEIVPIKDAEGLSLTDAYFKGVTIPRGALCERPVMPSEPTTSLSTVAYLAVKADASDRLVNAALRAIHEENLRLKAPTLISRRDAVEAATTKLHAEAHRYFHPADQVGFMANIMESLAAGKELLVALGAGVFLIWRRWRMLKERELAASLSRQKEHLDLFMEQTLSIEAAQAKTDDVEELYAFLNAVTDIKLKALHEFTEEELRADQVFRIFLAQCANLINKIQLKILWLKTGSAD